MIGKISGSYQRTAKTMDHKGNWDINCRLCAGKSSPRIERKTGGIENQKKNRDYPDHSNVKTD